MKYVLLCGLALFICLPALAQQDHVNRYDLYTGYSQLNSPSVSLQQYGFNTSFGVNVNGWFALGGDFSALQGNGSIALSGTKAAPLLAPFLNGQDPSLPFSATTYTFAVGPQLNIRKWKKLTLFVRPGLGVLHERAELKAPPNLAPLISLVPGLAPQLTNTVVFYGGGGGFDYNANRHMAIRVSADFIHTNLFSDLLQPRNAIRVSVGPTWRWGDVR